MTVSEVRKRYLAFFAARGHVVIPSAPIVPGNDPTTLFTSSGMQPLVPYLLGKDHPAGNRVTNSQMSFRAGDIEEVGDNRHTTFFEMLGNWSLGDYFKKEQLPWFFEFLTNKEEGLGLDPSKLYVTVFAGDEGANMPADMEAVEIWTELFKGVGIHAEFANIGSEADGYAHGMNGNERIFAYDAKKNWWSRAGVPANMP
ncbi:MAG: alanine--tRNA ligase-related protein, partial [Patescibacteria group bacterium]